MGIKMENQMHKIINIRDLGTDYTVTTPAGKIIDNIHVIPYTDLIDVFGYYESDHDTYSSYMSESIAKLTGNKDLDPYSVLWYTTTEEEVVLSTLIEYAVKHGYSKVILEYITDDDE